MKYLSFEQSESTEGPTTLDAMAATSAEHHAAVLAEVEQVLAWARRHFPDTQGPADEGNDWDHDLQLTEEEGQWHTVSLTLTGSPLFVAEFLQVFGDPQA